MTTKSKYYDIREDLEAYPLAWLLLVWSKRGPGKTYSTLRYMREEEKTFLFLKRTKKDIELLCGNGIKKGVEYDVSPFKPLNRDFGWNIGPVLISEGFAGFYLRDPEGKPYGSPIGYAAALSAASDIKGFDLSDCDYMIFDEFIPRKGERIFRNEGEQLLNIYMTVRRDRVLRGKDDLKLICLANAEQVNNPTFHMFDVIDIAVTMDVTNTNIRYLDDRRILLHMINNEVAQEEEKSGIELAMEGTAWAEMAFGGHFAYDDFTTVKHTRLKGYRPLCSYEYKKKTVYIYEKDGYYYASLSKAKVQYHYNLNRENEQKKFFLDFVCDLRDECIEDRFTFEQYTMYDLIINYRKIFEL